MIIKDYIPYNLESYMEHVPGITGEQWEDVRDMDWTDYYPVVENGIVEAVIIGEDAPRVAEEYGLTFDEGMDAYIKEEVV